MSRRLLLVSNDHIGREMAGPGIRYYEFARELSKRFEVTLVVPDETDAELGGIGALHIRPTTSSAWASSFEASTPSSRRGSRSRRWPSSREATRA
jgi:hypothetical protein